MNTTNGNVSLHSTPFSGGAKANYRHQNTPYEAGLEWPFAMAPLESSPSDADALLGYRSELLLYIVLVATMVEPYSNMREYYQRACTGTLLRGDLVLTLATCVQGDADYDPDPSQTVIYRRGGVPLRALKIFLFKKFNYAVIVMENSDQTEFPSLPMGELPFSDVRNSCFLAGYGNQQRLLLANFKIRWLKNVQVKEISCKKPNHLCLNFYKLIPCRGDMGSPLICGGHVYALFKPRRGDGHGRECIERYKTVFQLVAPGASWISLIIESPSTTLQWLNDPWYLIFFCVVVLAFIGGIYYCLIEALQKSFRMSVRDETGTVEGALSTATSSALSERRWVG